MLNSCLLADEDEHREWETNQQLQKRPIKSFLKKEKEKKGKLFTKNTAEH